MTSFGDVFKTRQARIRLVFALTAIVFVCVLNGIALLQLLSGSGAWGFFFANGIILLAIGGPAVIYGVHHWIENGDRL